MTATASAADPQLGLTTTRSPFIERAQSEGRLYIEQPYDLYSPANHEAWRAALRANARSVAEVCECPVPAGHR